MAAECYFNAPDVYLKSALWTDGELPQLPGSTKKYLKLLNETKQYKKPGSI